MDPMSKKRAVLATVLILILTAQAALAQTLAPAAPERITLGEGLKRLERYAAWQEAEDEGTWSVWSNETAAALNQLSQETPGTGTGYFYLALTGDRATGLIQPELVFCHVGTETIGADVVSVAVSGTRYDFRVTDETRPLGSLNVEFMTAPLDQEGLSAVRAMAAATTVRVKLLGEESYTFTAERRDSYTTTRAQIEGSSLKGLTPMLDELDALGIASYALWDKNAARWKALFGFEPEMAATRLGQADDAIALDQNFEMLSRDDRTAGVRTLQELLIDTGFMQGRADGSFGDGTVRAVTAARRYYGLMPCGIADHALISCLRGQAGSDGEAATADEETQPLGGVCAVGLDRFWLAGSVATPRGEVRSAVNRDNALFIAEGVIENTSPAELAFYRQLTAELTLGEAAYACTIVCESDGGARYDTALLPRARARLVVYAEVPRTVSGETGWALTLTAGSESQTWTVAGQAD